jgi:hypothetical protein
MKALTANGKVLVARKYVMAEYDIFKYPVQNISIDFLEILSIFLH